MNRSIDASGDLYVFGMWVHCHIARQPPPLSFEIVERHFCAALTPTALREPGVGRLEALVPHHANLTAWAGTCPENC